MNLINGEIFRNKVWVGVFVICLIYIFIKCKKRARISIIASSVAFFLVFNNSYIFNLLDSDSQDTFYRFVWIIPVTIIFAVVYIFLTEKRSFIWKVLFVLILFCLGRRYDSTFLTKFVMPHPENKYLLENRAVFVTDRFEEILGSKIKGNVLIHESLQMQMRLLSARPVNIIPSWYYYYHGYDDSVYDEAQWAMRALTWGSMDYEPEVMKQYFTDYWVEYVIMPKCNTRGYVESCGCEFIMEEAGYEIYKFNREE